MKPLVLPLWIAAYVALIALSVAARIWQFTPLAELLLLLGAAVAVGLPLGTLLRHTTRT